MLDIVNISGNQRQAFHDDVVAGLSRRSKTLPSRWLYDDRGSELFEMITRLEEYYPTRTEIAILRRHGADIAAFAGRNVALLEYGAGAGIKTEILIAALDAPQVYVPIDIAGDFVLHTAARMQSRFPRIETATVIADFTAEFDIPQSLPLGHRVAFFPGSTIGNLDPDETGAFLRQVRRHVGPGGKAIIGFDLKKDLDVLLPAYDDRAGVTAAFNLNLLARINRQLGGNFDLERFAHEARWNDAQSAVEMHLVSQGHQSVRVDGFTFAFGDGESIHTESSRKYDLASFAGLMEDNHWRVSAVWTDPRAYFAVVGLDAR
jgi:dimethylhistidine N-methyltransferase